MYTIYIYTIYIYVYNIYIHNIYIYTQYIYIYMYTICIYMDTHIYTLNIKLRSGPLLFKRWSKEVGKQLNCIQQVGGSS